MKYPEIIENIDSPSAVNEAVSKILSEKIAETVVVPEAPDFTPVLESVHGHENVVWDINEGKYFDKESAEFLTEEQVKEHGLPEDFAEYGYGEQIAECRNDIVDLIAEDKVSDVMEKIHEAIDLTMAQTSLETQIDESAEEMVESKIITKVSSTGEKRRKIYCGPGRELKNGVCVIIQGSEKVNRKLGSIKAAKTKRSKGAGYALKIEKKKKKAQTKRKSYGL